MKETCELIRVLREQHGFCPDCGMQPLEKDYNQYHKNGKCEKE